MGRRGRGGLACPFFYARLAQNETQLALCVGAHFAVLYQSPIASFTFGVKGQ